ncbi:hypothetical protein OIV83_001579 [Microbotryomycetes sp. JL201]|nr:hypothetical protein OIV83_001579 [Microbotryomycetes sp. JL201]
MNLRWKPTTTPDERAFECHKRSIDAGATLINNPFASLKLLGRFFARYPEYVDKVLLIVKGGIDVKTLAADASPEFIRASVLNINKQLGDHKKMDVCECSRVDKDVPIEDTMRLLLTLRDEGHFKYIGLSEVSADTIRRANEVAPITNVEVEYSLEALDIERNGGLEACKELSIPIVAYALLCRGLLSGAITTEFDIPEHDMRHIWEKFQGENLKHNLKLVNEIKQVVDVKGVTPTKIAIAWLLHAWDSIIPIPGSTRPEGVTEALKAAFIELNEAELKQIRVILDQTPVVGRRYDERAEAELSG